MMTASAEHSVLPSRSTRNSSHPMCMNVIRKEGGYGYLRRLPSCCLGDMCARIMLPLSSVPTNDVSTAKGKFPRYL